MIPDYKEILKTIYQPEIGSIWACPNKIWVNEFAATNDQNNFHPGIIAKVNSDNISLQIAPGTSQYHDISSCTFSISLQGLTKKSFFLLKLSMPYTKKQLLELNKGWNGVEELTEDQLHDFKFKVKTCNGWNV